MKFAGPRDRRPRAGNRWGVRLPLLLFVTALALALFFAGMYVQQAQAFPAVALADAAKTLRVLAEMQGLVLPPDAPAALDDASGAAEAPPAPALDALARLRQAIQGFNRPTRIPRAQIAAARFEFLDGASLAAPVIVQGGRERFRELCPGTAAGCLAVVYAGAGEVVHAYPYRLDALPAANIVAADDYPYEHPPGWSFGDNTNLSGSAPYPNGDLLVAFHFRHGFPYGGGVARIAPDGQPRWYRQDFSHHWPTIGEGDIALVPGLRVGRERPVTYALGSHRPDMTCPPERLFDDYVTLIDGQGQLLEAISVLDALAASPYSGVLERVRDSCDPTHLNFAHRLGPDAGGAPDLQPGDIVISLRGLDAFALLDRDDYRLKRFVRGSFFAQHSVRHLTRAQFLLFDNWGTDGRQGPSRLVRVDLATGAETTLFPTRETPDHLRLLFTEGKGYIDVSPDRRRVLITDVQGSRGLEIRLADGQVLTVFHNLHDVAHLPALPPELADVAWHFKLYSLAYAPAAAE